MEGDSTNQKILISILILFIVFLGLGSVNASEFDDGADAISSVDHIDENVVEQSQDNPVMDSVDSGYELSQSCENENSLSTFKDSYGEILNADHVTVVTDDYRYDVDTWNNKSFKV